MNHMTTNTASALNNLIEACRDGYFAYQEADSQIASQELQGYFNLVSQERLRFGQDLLLEVFKADAELGSCGLNTTARPLPWRNIKGCFVGQDNRFILHELGRLEAWTAKIYDAALQAESAPELCALLARQAAECQRVHDNIRQQYAQQFKPGPVKRAQPVQRGETAAFPA